MEIITPKYQAFPSLKQIQPKRPIKKTQNINKLCITSPKCSKVYKQRSYGMHPLITTSSAKKNSNSITKFLFEKRNTFTTTSNKNINNNNSKLKHNKSCEDAMFSNTSSNTLNAKKRFFGDDYTHTHNKTMYNSLLYESNLTVRRNSIGSGSIPNKNKKRNTKRKNICESEMKSKDNKHHVKNIYINASSPSIAERLEDKFKHVDDPIIDKNFEKDIDNDEIILANDNNNNKRKYNEIASTVMIDNYNEYAKTLFNDKCKETLSFSDDDNYYQCLMNNSNNNVPFDSLRNDFELFYTNDYITHISNGMLKLELQLEIDKILEMQEAYHKEYKILKHKYYTIKNKFKKASELYIDIDNKMHKLKHLQERLQVKNTMSTFITNHKLKHNKELTKINLNECDIWKRMLGLKGGTHSHKSKMGKEKEFILMVLKKYIYGSNKTYVKLLNEVEQLICDRLCKRYFTVNSNKCNSNSKKHNSNKSNINNSTIQRNKRNNYNINIKSPVVRNLKYNHSNFIAQTPLSASSKNIMSNRLSSSGRKSMKTNLKIKKYN